MSEVNWNAPFDREDYYPLTHFGYDGIMMATIQGWTFVNQQARTEFINAHADWSGTFYCVPNTMLLNYMKANPCTHFGEG